MTEDEFKVINKTQCFQLLSVVTATAGSCVDAFDGGSINNSRSRRDAKCSTSCCNSSSTSPVTAAAAAAADDGAHRSLLLTLVHFAGDA